MRKFLLAGAIALASVIYPMESHALCQVNGTITALQQDASPGTFLRIHLRPIGLATFRFFATTNDRDIMTIAWSAHTGLKHVIISGTATSCPTTGLVRSIGAVDFIDRF